MKRLAFEDAVLYFGSTVLVTISGLHIVL